MRAGRHQRLWPLSGGKRGSSDTDSTSQSTTPRSSFQTESTILSTPRSSFQFADSPTHSSKAGVVVTSSRASTRRSVTFHSPSSYTGRSSSASASAAFAAATAAASNPPEPVSQPPSHAGSRLASAAGPDLKIPNAKTKRESMISTAATMRVLNVLRHWVSKHSQDFENDSRLLQLTMEFLEELSHNPGLLPAEHKAAAQLLQMISKQDQDKILVDLDSLLATPMSSVQVAHSPSVGSVSGIQTSVQVAHGPSTLVQEAQYPSVASVSGVQTSIQVTHCPSVGSVPGVQNSVQVAHCPSTSVQEAKYPSVASVSGVQTSIQVTYCPSVSYVSGVQTSVQVAQYTSVASVSGVQTSVQVTHCPSVSSKDTIETLSALEIAEGVTYLDHKIFISIRSEFLTNEQKLCRLVTCEDMLEMTRTDPEWKDKIITGNETWVYGSDPETKSQSADWRGQDIAPNDFFMFPKLKAVLKERHFDTRNDIIEKSLLALKSIPKEAYKNWFDNWEKR
ncbi:RASGRF1 [Cordylochernes scorpioides]|uniref:RASGRF1 n=1 Tax=Cordylochernes scorpioides TaxID=51811 RepID=A0ABY6L6R5_9ARAC|nr:RASGRF1 [Cordylochernes scorpioides]